MLNQLVSGAMSFNQYAIVTLAIAAHASVLSAQGESPDQKVDDQIAQYPGAPFEDREGNLWFPTVLNGLIRFDGDEFQNFTKDDGLGSNMIRDIIEGEDGIIWIGTSGGLTQYDGKSFVTMADYEPFPIKRGFGDFGNHRDLSDVLIDRTGQLWISTADGVFQFDGEMFTRFAMPVIAKKNAWEFAPEKVSCIYEDQAGHLWFGTDGAGVVHFDGEEMTVYTKDTHGLSSDNVSEIYQDSRGDFWFGTANGGVTRYDGEAFTTHLRSDEFSIHHGRGRYLSIHEDREGNVWMGAAFAGGGVYRFDGDSFEYFSTDSGLGKGGVPSIREDRDGNLWLGTTTGVFHYDGLRFVPFTKSNPELPASWAQRGGNLLEGWPEEVFDLPPGFAPDLPKGTESLRFAPGWRDPNSEEFWSYAFVMWIDEPVPDIERVDELVEIYYSGLMNVFAGNRGKDISHDPVRVEVKQVGPNQYEAEMHLIDAFATFEPKDIRVLIETEADDEGHSFVHIQVSQQPEGHEIWKSLEAAIDWIRAQ